MKNLTKENRKTLRRISDIDLKEIEHKVRQMEKEEVAILDRVQRIEKNLTILQHDFDKIKGTVEGSSNDIKEILNIYRNSKGAVWFLRLSVLVGTPIFLAWVWLKSHVTFVP